MSLLSDDLLAQMRAYERGATDSRGAVDLMLVRQFTSPEAFRRYLTLCRAYRQELREERKRC